jgi:hypothetical protein
MVFNATFNNISVISWPSVLLVNPLDETGGPKQNPDLSQVTDKLLSHSVVHLAVIDTDCIGSCKSNYHTITAK